MRPLLDRSAATMSALCVAHCMAGAVAVAASAPLEPILGHGVHVVGILIALPLALFALVRGWRGHGNPLPIVIGASGLSLMLAGLVVPHGGGREFALSATGAGLLALAHWRNLRLCNGRRA